MLKNDLCTLVCGMENKIKIESHLSLIGYIKYKILLRRLILNHIAIFLSVHSQILLSFD